MIHIITAISDNRAIGKDNRLLWHLPEDLKRFKKITTNNVVVMGRKTHESIGRSLPNRINVILTKDTKWYKPLGDGCVVCYSIEEVLERFKHRDIFVIGGGQIYKEFLPYTDIIELTLIDKEYEGDTFFPILGDEWKEITRETHTNDEFQYHYIQLVKS